MTDTVKVPEQFEPVFRKAQEYVAKYFTEIKRDPTKGTLEISGERYILVRAASMSVDFFDTIRKLYRDQGEEEAHNIAKQFLFDIAHSIGMQDARNFHLKQGLKDPVEKLSTGPVHFAYSGWAFVDISPESSPSPDENYYLLYDHPYSFESDSWLRAGRQTVYPVCVMNSGYSSGWCEESFGLPLVASEIMCRARGDVACRFIMAPPSRMEGRIKDYLKKEALGGRKIAKYEIPGFFKRKQLEDERRRAEEQLAQNEVLLRQAQKMEAVGRLAGGVAHDFNNLLTAIDGYSVFLLESLSAGDPRRADVEEIKKAGERAAALTRQLLAFSRRQVMAPQMLNLNIILNNMQKLLSRLIGEHFELSLLPELALDTITADPGQLEQVIMNIALNARDAMPGGGRILIETHNVYLDEAATGRHESIPVGQYVQLAISDNGPGMDADTQSHIFEPFFTTKKEGKGTGLGLSTVYGIVKQSGGYIYVYSEAGLGTTFKIYLPTAEPAAVEPAAAPVCAEPSRGGAETILVVEDEALVRGVICRTLREKGYTVLEARDGAEALDVLAGTDKPVGLVLTDLVMPKMGGVELGKRLKTDYPQIKVIYASGYTDEAIIQTTGLKPGTSFLQKPITQQALLRSVTRTLWTKL